MSASLPRRRYLALWLPRLPTDRIERRRPSAGTAPDEARPPLATVERTGNAFRLAAINRAAAEAGLAVGLPLADAKARVPALATVDADPAGEAAALARLADWSLRWTPFAGLDPPDGLMLDITGGAHLFGGEIAMRAEVIRAIEGLGFAVRAAIADTPGGAWGMVRFGRAASVPVDATGDALQLLPVEALKLEPETATALRRVGLAAIGDLLRLPRAPLAARFGAPLLTRLDQVLGRQGEAIAPRLPLSPHLAERRLAEPIQRQEDVLTVIAILAADLTRDMELAGKGACRLRLTLFNVDGRLEQQEVGTTRPTRDAGLIATLFRERLKGIPDEFETGCGFDLVRLAVTLAAPLAADQLVLGASRTAAGAEITALIDRFGARFGPERIRRAVFADTHIPEQAARLLPVAGASRSPARRLPERLQQESLGPLRPLRLFARPERIETIAAVPDGLPVQFRWRRIAHRVRAVEGPERIAMEWWRVERTAAPTRDYFRVEDAEGRRYWLFREGLYDRETEAPRWFLHGLFA